MVFFNYALRKLNAKIVYYGPGLCGKTTNLQWIHDHFEGGEKGKMVSLATEGDRTIFFDLLPIEIGTIRGMDVTLQLYTVPGQVHYNSTRQLVLRGADGVVFVGDSQRTMRGSNQESLVNLEENLKLQGINLAEFPHALQFNKRDLNDLMSIEEMDGLLNNFDVPIFEGVAVDGIGVQETLEGIVRLVMRSLRERYEAQGAKPQPATPPSAGSWPVNLPSPAGGAQPQVPAVPSVPTMPSPASPPPAAPAPMDHSPLETRPPSVGPWGFQSPNLGAEVQADEPTDVYKANGAQAEDESAGFGFVEPKDESWQVDEPTDPQPDSTSVDVLPPDELSHEETEVTKVSEPPPENQGESFEGAEPLADEVDTHTDILIPPAEDDDLEGSEHEPDLLETAHEVDEPNQVDESQQIAAEEPAFEPEPEPLSESEAPIAEPESAQIIEEGRQEPAVVFDPIAPPAAPEIDFGATGKLEDQTEAWDSDPRTVEIDPSALPPAAKPEGGPVPQKNVDDLVATVLGTGPGIAGGEAPSVADTSVETELPESPAEVEAVQGEDVSPFEAPAGEPLVPEEPPVAEVEAPPTVMEDEVAESGVEAPSKPKETTQVFFLSDDDPFVGPDVVDEPEGAEVFSAEGEIEPVASPVEVSAEDNSLALKLSGTGALVESGQVRALDIEVPVPGKWVGNRRVTLQLRLTLAPAEDEDDR